MAEAWFSTAEASHLEKSGWTHETHEKPAG